MHRTDDEANEESAIERVSANAEVVTQSGETTPGPAATGPAATGPAATGPEKTDPVPDSAAELGAAGSARGDVVNVLRGFCMGAADTVPGVSGGTIALILGHYERLVAAISHLDGKLIHLLMRKQYRAAAAHLDFRFLVALVTGILIGVGTLAGLMHWLLDHRLPETLAVFLGLLIASIWIVRTYIDRWSPSRFATFAGGTAVAFVITQLPTGTGNTSLWFLFGSAAIAICAMILPGISGAFVLLLLGVYHTATGLIKDFVKLNLSADLLIQIAVFGAGCLFGLLAFSRLLQWSLKHYQGATMAGLMGLMVGSIGKLWPLQIPTPETADLETKFRVMQYVTPSEWTGSLLKLALLATAALVAVLAIERLAALTSPEE